MSWSVVSFLTNQAIHVFTNEYATYYINYIKTGQEPINDLHPASLLSIEICTTMNVEVEPTAILTIEFHGTNSVISFN